MSVAIFTKQNSLQGSAGPDCQEANRWMVTVTPKWECKNVILTANHEECSAVPSDKPNQNQEGDPQVRRAGGADTSLGQTLMFKLQTPKLRGITGFTSPVPGGAGQPRLDGSSAPAPVSVS